MNKKVKSKRRYFYRVGSFKEFAVIPQADGTLKIVSNYSGYFVDIKEKNIEKKYSGGYVVLELKKIKVKNI